MGIGYKGIWYSFNRNLSGSLRFLCESLCNLFRCTEHHRRDTELHRGISDLLDLNRSSKKLYPFTFIPLYLLFIISTNTADAQSTRGLINEGVELYKEQNFADAEVNFKKGTEKSPDNFEAKFNLGDAYYKQERYEEAIKSFQSAFVNARGDEEKAKIFHNIGNSLLKSQKIKESIGAYKEALKLNPNDQETKYNLSYALEMLKNPDQNQQQNQQNDQNQDENQDQQQQQQNQDQQNQDQQNQDQQEQQQQQQEQKISQQEAKRILDALKENEKDLQKQLRKIKGERVKTEKDW